MIIGTWNVRGLNLPLKAAEVVDFLKMKQISVFGLMETRMQTSSFNKFMKIGCITGQLRIILSSLIMAALLLFGTLAMWFALSWMFLNNAFTAKFLERLSSFPLHTGYTLWSNGGIYGIS